MTCPESWISPERLEAFQSTSTGIWCSYSLEGVLQLESLGLQVGPLCYISRGRMKAGRFCEVEQRNRLVEYFMSKEWQIFPAI